MKFRDVPQSGSQGHTVASRNRSGPYHRERVAPAQPATDAQCAAWRNMSDLSRVWNLVEERQRIAWGGLAEGLHSTSNLGIAGRLSGVQLFKKLNLVLATCGRPLLLDPPPLPEFGPNPVKGFEIAKAGRDIALILKASSKFRWKARSSLEDFMVQGWAPLNAGTQKNSLYTFLGLLPAPLHGEWDITDLYMEKLLDWRELKNKRYQIPLAGSKIFIRVVQQMNGWENEVWAFSACALAPMDDDLRTLELAALLKGRTSARRHQ
jgi:hypothetical protein